MAADSTQLLPPVRDLVEELARCVSPDRVLTRALDRVAFASDASFYRLLPEAVVLAGSVEEVQRLFALSRARNIPLTFRAAGTSLSGQSLSDGLLVEVARHWRWARVEDGGLAHPGPAGDDRRPPQRAAPALRTEDRTGPGEHPLLHPGGHPGQQQQRDVLRRGAEQLPHAPLADLRAALRHAHRHRRRRRRRPAPRTRAGAPPGPAHAPRRGALAARRWRSASGRSTG